MQINILKRDYLIVRIYTLHTLLPDGKKLFYLWYKKINTINYLINKNVIVGCDLSDHIKSDKTFWI